MTGKVYGQPGNAPLNDTICVKIVTYQKLVIAAEQKKLLEQQVSILNERIVGYEAMIKFLNEKDTATVGSYERQIAVMHDQRKIFEAALKDNEKVIRKLKRKIFWTSAAGVVGMGTMAFLLLTK